MNSIKGLWRVTSAISSPNVRGSKKIYLARIPQRSKSVLIVEAYTLIIIENLRTLESSVRVLACWNSDRGKATPWWSKAMSMETHRPEGSDELVSVADLTQDSRCGLNESKSFRSSPPGSCSVGHGLGTELGSRIVMMHCIVG